MYLDRGFGFDTFDRITSSLFPDEFLSVQLSRDYVYQLSTSYFFQILVVAVVCNEFEMVTKQDANMNRQHLLSKIIACWMTFGPYLYSCVKHDINKNNDVMCEGR